MASGSTTVSQDFDVDSVVFELQKAKFPSHKWKSLAGGLRVARFVPNIEANQRNAVSMLQELIHRWVGSTTGNQWVMLIEAVVMCDEPAVAQELATAVGCPLARSGGTAVGTTMQSTVIDRTPLTLYVDKLKRVYQTPPITWLSLPNCKHIKLAMTNEKGTRYIHEPDELIRYRVRGEIESLMASKMLIDMDSIFDEGIFENAHPPLVILVEGKFGSGKSTLAYHYCQTWAKGNLGMFELVALVYLRHPVVHSAGFDFTLHQLLLLASGGEEGIDDNIVRNIVQCIKDGLKFLLILDGWNEGPACIRVPPNYINPTDNSYLSKLLHSVSPNATILITSRPDSSIYLRRSYINRVEILGFTKESIHDYFREALSTQLPSTILEVGYRKIIDHLANYPAIESSCYLPLNAAILTLLYLQRNCTLPATHFEMFHELLLLFIAREVNTHQPKHNLGTISSLDDLPHDLMIQLHHISILAYEGVMKNKIVFTKDELPSILPKSTLDTILNLFSQFLPMVVTPGQHDLSAMGVLQRVQWARNNSESLSYNFIHLSIQEMLAAYRISQMANDEQMKVFQALPKQPRFDAVLQFYAGFTKLANEDVRNVIISTCTSNELDVSSRYILLSYVRCFFEAQITNQSLYQKLVTKLNGTLRLSPAVSMSPLDCMSVGYFLAFALRSCKRLTVDLFNCNINDHTFGLMMGELSKHAKSGVSHGVIELDISSNRVGDNSIPHIFTADATITKLGIDWCRVSHKGAESLARALTVNRTLQELDISSNEIGDSGIAHIATSLQTNTTLVKLCVKQCNISDKGAESLARALAVNMSLQELNVIHNKEIGDNGIAHIATALRTNTTLVKLCIGHCGISDKGAESLARALTVNMSLQELDVSGNFKMGEKGVTHIATALQTNTAVTKLNISQSNTIAVEKGEFCALARALAVNKSLQELDFAYNKISYNGTAQIAASLQINSTLKSLIIGVSEDDDALLIAAALTTNKTMEYMRLFWSSTHPDHALKNIGLYVSKSTLKGLHLSLSKPFPYAPVSEQKEWLQCLVAGGTGLISSLEDSFVEKLLINQGNVIIPREYHQSFEETTATVNMARRQKGLPEICLRLQSIR